jgi:sulfur-oxidizing protein SoxZ
MASTKIRAKEKSGVVTVKALMTHPMETGLRKDKKTGNIVPAHHITEITCESAGKTVMTCLWSGGISKNPYLSFKYAGKQGDELKLTWVDNQGASETTTDTVG